MIAQVPSVTFDEMARFAVCVVLLAWVAQLLVNIYRALYPYQPPPKHGELYVTHDQFNIFEAKVNAKIDALGASLEAKMTGFDRDVNNRLERLDVYMHESAHRTNNILASQVAATAELRGILIGKVGPVRKLEEDQS